MNKSGILLLLAMGLAAACDQVPMTRYEYGDITLEVGGRIKTVPPETAAVGDLDPSVRYSPDSPVKQVTIEVRFLSADDRFQEILGAEWLLASGETISPTSVEDTTQRSGGGGLSFGFDFGGFGGLGDQDDDLASDDTYTDDNLHRDDDDLADGGVGIVFPIGEGYRVTSANFLFDLQIVPILNENHQLLLLLKVAETDDGKTVAQPLVLPVILTTNSEQSAIALRTAVLTHALVRRDQTLVISSPNLTEVEARSQMPLLGDLPVLGRLFQSTGDNVVKKDLLVFITPHIVAVE